MLAAPAHPEVGSHLALLYPAPALEAEPIPAVPARGVIVSVVLRHPLLAAGARTYTRDPHLDLSGCLITPVVIRRRKPLGAVPSVNLALLEERTAGAPKMIVACHLFATLPAKEAATVAAGHLVAATVFGDRHLAHWARLGVSVHDLPPRPMHMHNITITNARQKRA